jgi:hypothetical protein
VRRRYLAFAAAVIGTPTAVITPVPDEPVPETEPEPDPGPTPDPNAPVDPLEDAAVAEFVEKFQLKDDISDLAGAGCVLQRHWDGIRKVLLAKRPIIADQNMVAHSYLVELLLACKEAGALTDEAVETLRRRYSRKGVGTGLAKLKVLQQSPELTIEVARAGFAVDLDAVLLKLPDDQVAEIDEKAANQPDTRRAVRFLREIAGV